MGEGSMKIMLGTGQQYAASVTSGAGGGAAINSVAQKKLSALLNTLGKVLSPQVLEKGFDVGPGGVTPLDERGQPTGRLITYEHLTRKAVRQGVIQQGQQTFEVMWDSYDQSAFGHVSPTPPSVTETRRGRGAVSEERRGRETRREEVTRRRATSTERKEQRKEEIEKKETEEGVVPTRRRRRRGEEGAEKKETGKAKEKREIEGVEAAEEAEEGKEVAGAIPKEFRDEINRHANKIANLTAQIAKAAILKNGDKKLLIGLRKQLLKAEQDLKRYLEVNAALFQDTKGGRELEGKTAKQAFDEHAKGSLKFNYERALGKLRSSEKEAVILKFLREKLTDEPISAKLDAGQEKFINDLDAFLWEDKLSSDNSIVNMAGSVHPEGDLGAMEELGMITKEKHADILRAENLTKRVAECTKEIALLSVGNQTNVPLLRKYQDELVELKKEVEVYKAAFIAKKKSDPFFNEAAFKQDFARTQINAYREALSDVPEGLNASQKYVIDRIFYYLLSEEFTGQKDATDLILEERKKPIFPENKKDVELLTAQPKLEVQRVEFARDVAAVLRGEELSRDNLVVKKAARIDPYGLERKEGAPRGIRVGEFRQHVQDICDELNSNGTPREKLAIRQYEKVCALQNRVLELSIPGEAANEESRKAALKQAIEKFNLEKKRLLEFLKYQDFDGKIEEINARIERLEAEVENETLEAKTQRLADLRSAQNELKAEKARVSALLKDVGNKAEVNEKSSVLFLVQDALLLGLQIEGREECRRLLGEAGLTTVKRDFLRYQTAEYELQIVGQLHIHDYSLLETNKEGKDEAISATTLRNQIKDFQARLEAKPEVKALLNSFNEAISSVISKLFAKAEALLSYFWNFLRTTLYATNTTIPPPEKIGETNPIEDLIGDFENKVTSQINILLHMQLNPTLENLQGAKELEDSLVDGLVEIARKDHIQIDEPTLRMLAQGAIDAAKMKALVQMASVEPDVERKEQLLALHDVLEVKIEENKAKHQEALNKLNASHLTWEKARMDLDAKLENQVEELKQEALQGLRKEPLTEQQEKEIAALPKEAGQARREQIANAELERTLTLFQKNIFLVQEETEEQILEQVKSNMNADDIIGTCKNVNGTRYEDQAKAYARYLRIDPTSAIKLTNNIEAGTTARALKKLIEQEQAKDSPNQAFIENLQKARAQLFEVPPEELAAAALKGVRKTKEKTTGDLIKGFIESGRKLIAKDAQGLIEKRVRTYEYAKARNALVADVEKILTKQFQQEYIPVDPMLIKSLAEYIVKQAEIEQYLAAEIKDTKYEAILEKYRQDNARFDAWYAAFDVNTKYPATRPPVEGAVLVAGPSEIDRKRAHIDRLETYDPKFRLMASALRGSFTEEDILPTMAYANFEDFEKALVNVCGKEGRKERVQGLLTETKETTRIRAALTHEYQEAIRDFTPGAEDENAQLNRLNVLNQEIAKIAEEEKALLTEWERISPRYGTHYFTLLQYHEGMEVGQKENNPRLQYGYALACEKAFEGRRGFEILRIAHPSSSTLKDAQKAWEPKPDTIGLIQNQKVLLPPDIRMGSSGLVAKANAGVTQANQISDSHHLEKQIIAALEPLTNISYEVNMEIGGETVKATEPLSHFALKEISSAVKDFAENIAAFIQDPTQNIELHVPTVIANLDRELQHIQAYKDLPADKKGQVIAALTVTLLMHLLQAAEQADTGVDAKAERRKALVIKEIQNQLNEYLPHMGGAVNPTLQNYLAKPLPGVSGYNAQQKFLNEVEEQAFIQNFNTQFSEVKAPLTMTTLKANALQKFVSPDDKRNQITQFANRIADFSRKPPSIDATFEESKPFLDMVADITIQLDNIDAGPMNGVLLLEALSKIEPSNFVLDHIKQDLCKRLLRDYPDLVLVENLLQEAAAPKVSTEKYTSDEASATLLAASILEENKITTVYRDEKITAKAELTAFLHVKLGKNYDAVMRAFEELCAADDYPMGAEDFKASQFTKYDKATKDCAEALTLLNILTKPKAEMDDVTRRNLSNRANQLLKQEAAAPKATTASLFVEEGGESSSSSSSSSGAAMRGAPSEVKRGVEEERKETEDQRDLEAVDQQREEVKEEREIEQRREEREVEQKAAAEEQLSVQEQRREPPEELKQFTVAGLQSNPALLRTEYENFQEEDVAQVVENAIAANQDPKKIMAFVKNNLRENYAAQLRVIQNYASEDLKVVFILDFVQSLPRTETKAIKDIIKNNKITLSQRQKEELQKLFEKAVNTVVTRQSPNNQGFDIMCNCLAVGIPMTKEVLAKITTDEITPFSERNNKRNPAFIIKNLIPETTYYPLYMQVFCDKMQAQLNEWDELKRSENRRPDRSQTSVFVTPKEYFDACVLEYESYLESRGDFEGKAELQQQIKELQVERQRLYGIFDEKYHAK